MTVRLGLEVLLESRPDRIGGGRVGLVASPSSVDRNLTGVVERLWRAPGVRLTALFGPEHGLRGSAQAGDHVETVPDPVTGLPAYSLYGETQKPTPDMLRDVDVMVVDLQDGGVRFYTYLYTLAYVMQAAAEQGKRVIVLDRPGPLGGLRVEGPLLDPAYASFVGLYPIPIRYGMTIGEIARLFNEAFGIGCDLDVIWMDGWRRGMWFDQTGLPFIAPSPNLPTLDSLTAYPGLCLVEGTNLSEGRGTTRPFEYIGAPWIDAQKLAGIMNDLALPGARFRPVYFVPTFSKHQGVPCQGVHVFVTDREAFRPVEVALHLLQQVRRAYPEQFAWREPWRSGGHPPIDLLTGGSRVRAHLDADQPIPALVNGWEAELRDFGALRARFLHYPA